MCGAAPAGRPIYGGVPRRAAPARPDAAAGSRASGTKKPRGGAAPAARGVANSYPDTSFPVSWDTNPGTVGAGWTMRFNVLRDNPISMLEYNFNGTALIDPP